VIGRHGDPDPRPNSRATWRRALVSSEQHTPVTGDQVGPVVLPADS
jgi:hypothetical protein